MFQTGGTGAVKWEKETKKLAEKERPRRGKFREGEDLGGVSILAAQCRQKQFFQQKKFCEVAEPK